MATYHKKTITVVLLSAPLLSHLYFHNYTPAGPWGMELGTEMGVVFVTVAAIFALGRMYRGEER